MSKYPGQFTYFLEVNRTLMCLFFSNVRLRLKIIPLPISLGVIVLLEVTSYLAVIIRFVQDLFRVGMTHEFLDTIPS